MHATMREIETFDKRVIGINICQALAEAVIVVGRIPRVYGKDEGGITAHTVKFAALKN